MTPSPRTGSTMTDALVAGQLIQVAVECAKCTAAKPWQRLRCPSEASVKIALREESYMGRKYQSILETVGNTPVVKINRLAPPGINLYVKVEAFNPLGSV